MDFNQFKEKWIGKTINHSAVNDLLTIDLIQQYVFERFGISVPAVNPIEFWNSPGQILLTRFSRVGGNDALQGDVVVFYGLAGNPRGDIGVATGTIDGSNVEVIVQNVDDFGESKVQIAQLSRSRIAGLLRPVDGEEFVSPSEEPPAPEIVEPEVVVSPGPMLPTAPVTAPSSEKYEVVRQILGYPTPVTAAERNGSDADVAIGTYLVFNRLHDMINLTTVPGQPGVWINPADNVEETIDPEEIAEVSSSGWESPRELIVHTPDWRTTYKPYLNSNGEHTYRRYVAMKTTVFRDLEAKLPDITLEKPREVNISGTFTKDNVVYLRPKKMTDQALWYGVQEALTSEPNLVPYNEVYNTTTTVEERTVLDTRKSSDYFVQFYQWLKKLKPSKG